MTTEKTLGYVNVDKQGTALHLIDVLKDAKGRVCYIKVVGQSQIAKKFWLSIAKMANSRTSEDTINTEFTLAITNRGVSSCRLRGTGGYTKTETQLGYGLACYTIFLGDMFDNQMISMSENKDEESLFSSFKKWASKLALPIPNDEELLRGLFLHLRRNSDCSVRVSEQEKVFGLFFDERLVDDSYFILREYIERFYCEREEIA